MRHRTLFVALGVQRGEAQHSPAEADALADWAQGKRAIAEVGVAEGASAAVLRRVMDPDGDLWLVDPFHLSRNPLFNSGLVAARRTIGRASSRGRVHFVVKRSLDAVRDWTTPLEFVFVDADHDYSSVIADWWGWSRHVIPGGAVAFHDAVPAPGHPDGPSLAIRDLFETSQVDGWEIEAKIETLVLVRRTEPSIGDIRFRS